MTQVFPNAWEDKQQNAYKPFLKRVEGQEDNVNYLFFKKIISYGPILGFNILNYLDLL